MRAFKSLKAYNFFADGFVKNMCLYQYPESSLVVIRAYCHHSLTIDSALQVFVCLSCTTGDVYTAQCNCVSGLGEACSHVTALLFTLEDIVRKGLKELPVELISKTSKPMEWNKPPKKHISPLPVKDISFTKLSYGRRMPQSKLDAPNVTPIHVHQLIVHYLNLHWCS